MAKQTKNQILGETENHQPKWLKWTTIKKKYPDKWIRVGFKDFQQVKEGVYFGVLGVFDTLDELLIFSEKYDNFFKNTGYYKGYSTKNTIKQVKTNKKHAGLLLKK
jgi:hypothetical protein